MIAGVSCFRSSAIKLSSARRTSTETIKRFVIKTERMPCSINKPRLGTSPTWSRFVKPHLVCKPRYSNSNINQQQRYQRGSVNGIRRKTERLVWHKRRQESSRKKIYKTHLNDLHKTIIVFVSLNIFCVFVIVVEVSMKVSSNERHKEWEKAINQVR